MYSRRPNPVFSEAYVVIREAVVQGRRVAGLSQAELAARLGKAKSHIAMIERGQRRIDTLELFRAAQAFGREPAGFFAEVAVRLEACEDLADRADQ